MGYEKNPDPKTYFNCFMLGLAFRLLSLYWTVRIGKNRFPFYSMYVYLKRAFRENCLNKRPHAEKVQEKEVQLADQKRKTLVEFRDNDGSNLFVFAFN